METMLDFLRDFLPESFGDTEQDTILRKKLGAIAPIYEKTEQRIEKAFEEIFAMTTELAISWWERMLQIPSDSSLDDELRRAKIFAKLLATPYMTKSRMEQIVNLFISDKSGEIIEFPKEYAFQVQLNLSSAMWIDELLQAVDEAEPAHYRHHVILNNKIETTGYEYVASVLCMEKTMVIEQSVDVLELSSIHIDTFQKGIISTHKAITIHQS